MLNLKNVGQGLMYNTALSEAFAKAVTNTDKITMHHKKEPSIKRILYVLTADQAHYYVLESQKLGFVLD